MLGVFIVMDNGTKMVSTGLISKSYLTHTYGKAWIHNYPAPSQVLTAW